MQQRKFALGVRHGADDGLEVLATDGHVVVQPEVVFGVELVDDLRVDGHKVTASGVVKLSSGRRASVDDRRGPDAAVEKLVLPDRHAGIVHRRRLAKRVEHDLLDRLAVPEQQRADEAERDVQLACSQLATRASWEETPSIER